MKDSDVRYEAANIQDAAIERLASLPTATVSDSLDALGLTFPLRDRPNHRSGSTGRAFTAH